MLLKNEWVSNEIKEEIKRYLDTNANENTMTQNIWDTVKCPKRDIHSNPWIQLNSGLSQQIQKISNKQPNLTH